MFNLERRRTKSNSAAAIRMSQRVSNHVPKGHQSLFSDHPRTQNNGPKGQVSRFQVNILENSSDFLRAR